MLELAHLEATVVGQRTALAPSVLGWRHLGAAAVAQRMAWAPLVWLSETLFAAAEPRKLYYSAFESETEGVLEMLFLLQQQ